MNIFFINYNLIKFTKVKSNIIGVNGGQKNDDLNKINKSFNFSESDRQTIINPL